MKIVAINGSHRGKKGNTHKLIEKLFEGASQKGAICEEILLSEHKINPCIDCKICNSEKTMFKCVYDDKDDVKMIFDKIREADLVIIASPVYLFTISGKLKIFLDRINSTADSNSFLLNNNGLFFHHIDEKLCSKDYVFIITCDNFMDETVKNSISYFKTYNKFMNGKIKGMLIRKSCKFLFNKSNSANSLKSEQSFNAFYNAGKEIAEKGCISKRTQKIASQNIIKIPFIIKIMAKFKIFHNMINTEMKKRNIS